MNITFQTVFAVVLTFLVADGLWLGWIRKNFYASEINRIQGSEMKVRLGSALVSYILMVVAVVILSIPRVKCETRFRDSVLYGGVLGLVIYGIYNATNYATLRKYSLEYFITDTLWGVFIMALATYMGSCLTSKK